MQFSSERALSQALRLLDYVALSGAACLVSPRGSVHLVRGAADELSRPAVTRAIAEHLAAHATRDWITDPGRWSTVVEGGCLYSTSVGEQLLCVLARGPLGPADVFARMTRVRGLLQRMLRRGLTGWAP